MANASFWKNKDLPRRKFSTQTKLKIINYIFSVLNYGADCWTWNMEMKKRVDAFEKWCYRRMLQISWKKKVSNIEILKRVDTKLHFGIDMWKRKLSFAGHVLRGSGGDSHLLVLEGKINGKRGKGRPRLTWMNNILRWINVGSYAEAKKWAGVRDSWRTMVVNLLFEDDK